MKIRTGFVSNSSSSSFIIQKEDISANQLYLLKKYHDVVMEDIDMYEYENHLVLRFLESSNNDEIVAINGLKQFGIDFGIVDYDTYECTVAEIEDNDPDLTLEDLKKEQLVLHLAGLKEPSK